MRINSWRDAASLIAVASTVAAGVALPDGALAQSPDATLMAQGGEQRAFNIPPQPLGTALGVLGQQSGRNISVDGAVVRGVSTQGVQGTMSIEEALNRLLSGTGLTYSMPNSSTITVQRVGAGSGIVLDPLQVQGYPVPQQAMIDNLPPPYAGGQVATGGQLGLLGNRDVMSTPFNQTSYTAKKAQDQQAKTIQDVLVDDPSVRTLRMDGSPGVDGVRIRGFNVQSIASAYGGLYGVLPTYSPMAEIAERVEILKGPSALLNGMQPQGAIGGTINIVPKRAANEDLTQITANYTSAGQVGGHADVSRRFGSDKQFGVRFNGVYRAGQTDVQWNSDERALALLGLDFRGENVRLSADLGYQYQYIGGLIGYIGLANGVPLPWAPSVRNNVGGQPWAYQERKDVFGTFRGEVDLTDSVTAYVSLGAHDNRWNGLYPFGVSVTNFYGTATASAPANNENYTTDWTAQAGLRALVTTGPIGHELVFTASTYGTTTGSAVIDGTAFATNIYNPTVVARPNIAVPIANKTSTQTLTSFGIADTLSAAEGRIQLTAGARLQQVTAANFNVVTGAQTSTYDQNAVSPAVALVFKPWQNVTLYGNWIQGLQQGTIVPNNFTNAGEVFPPFKATQYEAGVKVDWGRLTTTASVFQIALPSILTDVTTNTLFLGGQQVNQGLELNVFGEVTEGVRVLGGAMFLNAALTKTQGGTTNGWIAPFSPGAQFNLAGEWDLPFVPGLTATGRITYTGAQYIDTTFPRRTLPEWARLDLGVRYAFENPGARGKLLVARFNVDNILDNNYWAGGAFGDLMLGAPRTFRVSLTADF